MLKINRDGELFEVDIEWTGRVFEALLYRFGVNVDWVAGHTINDLIRNIYDMIDDHIDYEHELEFEYESY